MKLLSPLLILFVSCFPGVAQHKSVQERLGYPKDSKLVILHADDLGVSHSKNSASIDAIENGCVNSASIMVPCPWFPEMAAYATQHPDADLGLHLTLTSEWPVYKWGPVTPKEKVPGLVNKKGFFYSIADSVIMKASAKEVEEEMRNQVKRAMLFGIKPTHLDAHMYTALSSLDFVKAYIKIGKEFDIPVFLPREIENWIGVDPEAIADGNVIFNEIVTLMPKDLSDPQSFYLNSFKNIRPGLTYYIIHVAYDNDEMQAVTGGIKDWGSAWRQTEYNFFSSEECSKALKENNIHLVTWKEIKEKLLMQ